MLQREALAEDHVYQVLMVRQRITNILRPPDADAHIPRAHGTYWDMLPGLEPMFR
jgi:hypothetical protein